MEITNSYVSSFNYFKLKGRMKNEDIIALQMEIDKAMKYGSKYFVFDFSKVEYINSSGLRIFIKLQKELKLFDGFLTIFAVSNMVAKIFNIAELNNLLRVRKSLDDILEDIKITQPN